MQKKRLFKIIKITGIISIISVLVMPVGLNPVNAKVNTSDSLFTGGSFEYDLDRYWQVWNSPDSGRTYDFFRSYDAAYGHGSYAAAIEASGSPTIDMFTAGMVANSANNTAMLTAGGSYIMTFYAKSSV
jgi:hypothetical protein